MKKYVEIEKDTKTLKFKPIGKTGRLQVTIDTDSDEWVTPNFIEFPTRTHVLQLLEDLGIPHNRETDSYELYRHTVQGLPHIFVKITDIDGKIVTHIIDLSTMRPKNYH